MICQFTKQQVLVMCSLAIVALTLIGIGTGLYVHRRDYSERGLVENNAIGGVVTNGDECAVIARDIIHKGGSIVDAGIATSICEGAAMPQSMGLGGGFFATFYIKDTGKVFTLNAREIAPSAATRDMFVNNTEGSTIDGLAVAVPGEIRGYQSLHRKFGILPWHELFQPTINLCRNGLQVNKYLDKLYKEQVSTLKKVPGFRDFINPHTGEPYQLGEKVKRMKLAETLEIIASEPDALHRGSLTKGFVDDIKQLGGIITEEDMNNYEPVWADPITMSFKSGDVLHTFPAPGSGVVFAHILRLLDGHLDMSNTNDMNNVTNWQRIIESFKFAYAARTKLGDPLKVDTVNDMIAKLLSPKFIEQIRRKMMDTTTSQNPNYYGANTSTPEDHGTAHINILAPNGDAFALTGTINLIFGAKAVSKTTGIILNNEMDDFATQPADPSQSANFISPGKRPLSSMCPSIILDANGNVRMLVGAAGGQKITTSTALVAIRHLWHEEDIVDAVKAPRMHHQLFPMHVNYEPEFNEALVNKLHRIGHIMNKDSPNGFGAVTAITNRSGTIEMSTDPRRCGSTVYIE